MSQRRNRPPSGKHNIPRGTAVNKDRGLAAQLNVRPQSARSAGDHSWRSTTPRRVTPRSRNNCETFDFSCSGRSNSSRPSSARYNSVHAETRNSKVLSSKGRPKSAASHMYHARSRGNNERHNALFKQPEDALRTPDHSGNCDVRAGEESSRPEEYSSRLHSPGLRHEVDVDGGTEAVLSRLRDKVEAAKKQKQMEDTRLMSDYNAFSLPRTSIAYPLRTVLLDPVVNNFPPSRTRSELMRKIKISQIPHPSYDIDGDGWVSQEDYKLSKRFDFDGNGVIDPDERAVAKHVIADEFFCNHKDELHFFGDQIAKASHEENVKKLEKAHCFERTLGRLKAVEESLKSRSSKEMINCMSSSSPDLTKYNYYTDKFDSTAWNSFDAIPRERGKVQHNGSRRELLQARRERLQDEATAKYEVVANSLPKYRTHKISLISNYALEN